MSLSVRSGLVTWFVCAVGAGSLYWQMPLGGAPADFGWALPSAHAAPPAQSRPTAPPQTASTQEVAPSDAGIRIRRGQKKVDTTLETAYAAFMRGETNLARLIWTKTLRSDAHNVDALLGLAAIAQMENRPDQATALYRRVLVLNPKDAAAYAGLLAIWVPTDRRQTESRLKGLLAEQPDSPHLHFALGNLYLDDARWAEARQAFSKAHATDPANPDYLYNLAVSLDHLRQGRLAAQYYARALVAAQSQTAAFDPLQVEARIKVLQAEHTQ